MVHLKRDRGDDCIKGIGFMNEPEQMTDYDATLAGVYRSLGAQLRRRGVRDDVAVQAFDEAIFWTGEEAPVADGVGRLLHMADADIDVISLHDYHSIFGHQEDLQIPRAHGTILDYTIAKRLLPALEQTREGDSDGQVEPFVVGEFGTFAISRGDTEADDTRHEQRLHSAEGFIQLMNHGAKAVAFWVHNNNHHAYWRMLTFDENDRRHFVPQPENCYPLALAMKHIPSGSDIVHSQVEGCADADGHPRVFLTVAQKGGDITLLWVNDSEAAARVTISGLRAGRALHHHQVTEEIHGRLAFVAVTHAAADVETNLMPRSIEVLTTYTYGSETVDQD
jgi:hypothetical protein